MSAKSIIQNLQDSELIRIFLDFVQTFHLQYEKIDKEISYKCHQATWILATTKATGYGRTQSEAYKHALRNLLQILIQDPPYTQFFVNIFSKNTANNNQSANSVYSTYAQSQSNPRPTQNLNNKQKPISSSSKSNVLVSHLSANLGSNSGSQNGVKRQLKTEAQYQYEATGFEAKGNIERTMSNNYQIGKSNHSQSSGLCPSPAEQNYQQNFKKQGYKMQSGLNQYDQRNECKQSGFDTGNFSHHSKIANSEQLRQALIRNRILTQELATIAKENQILKIEINNINACQNKNKNSLNNSINPNPVTSPTVNSKGMRFSMGISNQTSTTFLQQPSHAKAYSHTNINFNIQNTNSIPNYSNNQANPNILAATNQPQSQANNFNIMRDITNMVSANQTYKQASQNITSKEQQQPTSQGILSEQIKPRPSISSNSKSKVLVPKLKLQILPNYHKKAEKSLNDSLLAIYEQKHGTVVSTAGQNGSILNGNIMSSNNIKKVI